MKTPLISVIVPVYKAEKYLKRCVDSILSQTFKYFELILVDDGSPDRSGFICEEYSEKDLRVKTFHKSNGGVSSARQMGLDNSQGKYVIQVDPDDWVEPDMLYSLFRKAEIENADMVICDFITDVGKRQYYEKQEPSSCDHEVVLKELFQHLHGSCCNKLVKRNCYNKYGVYFLKELSYCEDLYTNAWLLKNPIKVTYLPKAFYHYDQVINPNSIVRIYTLKNFYYELYLKEKFKELLRDTELENLVEVRMSCLLISRAFDSKIFDSYSFKKNCYIYHGIILKGEKTCKKYFIFVACIGGYTMAYYMWICFVRLRNMNAKIKSFFSVR